MKTPTGQLLQYAWLLSLAIAVLFVARYTMLSRALKKKGQPRSVAASEENWMDMTEDVAVKEQETMLLRLIDAKICIKTFLLVTIAFFALSNFF